MQLANSTVVDVLYIEESPHRRCRSFLLAYCFRRDSPTVFPAHIEKKQLVTNISESWRYTTLTHTMRAMCSRQVAGDNANKKLIRR